MKCLFICFAHFLIRLFISILDIIELVISILDIWGYYVVRLWILFKLSLLTSFLGHCPVKGQEVLTLLDETEVMDPHEVSAESLCRGSKNREAGTPCLW